MTADRARAGRAAPDRRAQVVRVLREAAEPLDAGEVARVLGVHVNTARFHLDALVAAGQAERTRAEADGRGRPALLFRPVRRMDPAGPRHYRLLAEILAGSIAGHVDDVTTGRTAAQEAGRVWGRAHAGPRSSASPTRRLLRLLDDLDFSPEPAGRDRTRIGLRSCPFLELAEHRSDVVCPLHLGLMQGALEAWGAEVGVERLEPFAEPDLCLVHLSPRAAS